jgi:hypothetical protein
VGGEEGTGTMTFLEVVQHPEHNIEYYWRPQMYHFGRYMSKTSGTSRSPPQEGSLGAIEDVFEGSIRWRARDDSDYVL